LRPSHYNSRYKDHLTPRQRQVADLLTRGKTNNEIAVELGLGWETVKSHVSEVLAKLGAETREEAAAYWHRDRSIPATVGRLARGAVGLLFGRWGAGTAVICSVAASSVLLGIVLARVTSEGDPQELPITREPAVAMRTLLDQGCCVSHQVALVNGRAFVTGPSKGTTSWQSQLVRFGAGTDPESVDLDAWPLALGAWHDQLWLAGPDAQSLERYAATNPRGGGEGPLGPPHETPGDPGDGSWIMAIDQLSLDVVQQFASPARIAQVAVSGTDVWAASPDDHLILHHDATTGRLLHVLDLDSVGEIAVDGKHVWATMPRQNKVVRIDGATGMVDAAAELPGTCGCGAHLAVAGDAVWVSLFTRGSVARIERSDTSNVREIALEADPQQIAAGADGSLWVVVTSTTIPSRLLRLDPSTGATISTTDLQTREGGIHAFAVGVLAVWVVDHAGTVIRIDR